MNHIDLKNKTIFVTGSAGFIGSNLVLELLRTQSPINIIGLDNMNDYYDVNIKEWRLQEIKKCVSEHSDSTYVFYKDDLADKTVIDKIFAEHKPDIVVNLGAQAGVRYSITNPDAYIQSNMIGFYNILEACRHSYDNGCKGVDHLVYASSSSVYGTNKKVPYSTEDKVDNPVSLYAATKKANELITKVCSAIDLDLESGSATSNANIPIDQIEVYNIDDEQTINLKQDGDGKDHFAMITVSISMDTKNSDYKELKPQVEEKVNLIKGDINNIVSQYTIDEIKNNQSAVQDEILKDLQKMFGSDFIVAVGFPTAQYQ
mgnify:CR=1 FL=1